jgi:uncharacterized membrane protein YbhN (UPF0104 family)
VSSVSPSSRKWLLLVVKLAVLALVIAGIAYEVYKAKNALAQQPFNFRQIDFRWLPLAGGVYLLGMLPMGIFWYAIMRALGQGPYLGETLRAFYIGHLGKYVPGKAMVVVLRTGFVRGQRVDTTVAAVSVFTETLTMMAVGAFLAAVILAVQFADQWMLLLVAVGLMLCAGVPTLPPIFRRLVYLLKVRKLNPHIGRLLKGLTWRLMVAGWLGNCLGWALFGVSLWATLRCLPPDGEQAIGLMETFPLMLATVCLAMVAGFLSLLPGGVLVREYIIITLLAPAVGVVAAMVSAILLRLVWLISEVFLAGVLYMSVRSSSRQSPEIGRPAGDVPTTGTRTQP